MVIPDPTSEQDEDSFHNLRDWREFSDRYEDDALTLLGMAQFAADKGEKWGKAISAAVTYMEGRTSDPQA